MKRKSREEKPEWKKERERESERGENAYFDSFSGILLTSDKTFVVHRARGVNRGAWQQGRGEVKRWVEQQNGLRWQRKLKG